MSPSYMCRALHPHLLGVVILQSKLMQGKAVALEVISSEIRQQGSALVQQPLQALA